MRAPRLSTADRKRMDALAAPRKGARLDAGVMVVPPRLPLDEWEAMAMQSQAELADATRDGIETRRYAEPS